MFAVVGLMLGMLLAQPETQNYHWPLDIAPQLTSSFAEYRSGRFHAGIDLRTGGIGPAVYAANDGYVSRIMCSPWGYGKAIYLQLADGNIAVYAHLDDYFPELRDHIRREQHQRQAYVVDLEFEPHQFPIHRGQHIAAAGMTGIGAPHLHYELRDSQQRPVNPRLLGLSWPDNIRPQVNQVLVVPREGLGTVNGDFLPVILEATNRGSGQYTTEPIRVSGEIGFGLDVVDPGTGGYRLGVHRMRLLADGNEHFRMQHDILDYDHNRNGVVCYHPFYLDKGRFLLLWRWPGNMTPSYSYSPEKGWLNVDSLTSNAVVIEINDFHENTATLTIPIQRETVPASFSPGISSQSGEVTYTVYGNALLVSVVFPEQEEIAPQLLIETAAGIENNAFVRVNDTTWRATFRPTLSEKYDLNVNHPRINSEAPQTIAAFVRSDTSRKFTLHNVEIEAASDSPHGVLFVGVEPVSRGTSSALYPLGDAWRIWPAQSPVDTPVTLRFPLPSDYENSDRVDMYRRRGNSYSRESAVIEDNQLVIRTRQLGTYQAMEDRTSPQVSDILPTQGYHAQTRRPHIRATVSDAGSGIANWRVTCSGEWLLVKYDPDHSRIEWERDHELPSGSQTILFEVTDGAGNVSRIERTVVVP